MRNHWTLVGENEDIRQGDIIQRLPSSGGGKIELGFILTADCDIANKKTGDKFTWLEIVTSHEYLENYWSIDQLRRFFEKQSLKATEVINGLIRKRDSELNLLVGETLSDWLKEKNGDEIIASIIALQNLTDKKILPLLRALRISIGFESGFTNMERLCKVWTLTGVAEANQLAKLKEVFGAERGFPDFVLIPNIPNGHETGFVILLRAISSISSGDLFRSQLDARINDRPDAFHRIGRFDDVIRYAVSQKLAFLFSRIGMSRDFEQDCDSATELLFKTRNYTLPKDIV
jgi:hypothetical protein